MAFWNKRPVTEAASAAAPSVASAPPTVRGGFARRGYDPDIPQGGTSSTQQSVSGVLSRQQEIDELYGAYMGCPPASTAVDAVARTITAGGLDVGMDSQDQQRLPTAAEKHEPAGVVELKALLGWVNPYEDIRQLCRSIVTDLQVTGDAFIEVSWAAGKPYALWHLDSATTTPIADEHGIVTGYKQWIGPGREATFAPEEVIHIRLDSPRGGVFGVSPTKKLRWAILGYIWTMALLKETMRKGNPPRFHMRFPISEDAAEIKRFRQSYPSRHLGPQNIGAPLISKGAETQEFKTSAIAEYLTTLADLRDVILSGYGVPGRKVGVAEPGSLGGAGVDLGADKTFRVNTCGPIAELILEKLNFALLRPFGIDGGWKIRFGDVDWRDELQLEQLRDIRLRNGTWTLDRYRDDIGEPPVEGGDVPVLVDRQNLVAWSDLPALSRATVEATKAKGAQPQMAGDTKPGQGDPPVTSLAPTVGKASETLRDMWDTSSLRARWEETYEARHAEILEGLTDAA